MPKKRVKSKKKSGGKLTDHMLYDLLGGEYTGFFFTGPEDMFSSEEEQRAAWFANRERLFYLQIDDDNDLRERAAYTRAPAWWNYEALEPRQIIKNEEYYDIEIIKYYGPDGKVKYGHEGTPYGWELKPEYEGKYRKKYRTNHDLPLAPVIEFESEKEYLIRLGLVTAWDRERELEPLRHLSEEEQQDMVKAFIKEVGLYKNKLQASYMYHLKGEEPMHDNKTWTDYYKEYSERAALLEEHAAGGKAAGQVWREALEDIKEYSEQEEAKEERAREAEEARKEWEKKKKQKGLNS